MVAADFHASWRSVVDSMGDGGRRHKKEAGGGVMPLAAGCGAMPLEDGGATLPRDEVFVCGMMVWSSALRRRRPRKMVAGNHIENLGVRQGMCDAYEADKSSARGVQSELPGTSCELACMARC